MDPFENKKIKEAADAALQVLIHNAHGPYHKLPRTAGWGYPEPYTRDLLLSVFGIAVCGNEMLMSTVRRVLETLARNQSPNGHIPSMVHDVNNRGASDTTPLFLLATGIYRETTGEKDFLGNAVAKALAWMNYQSPSDRCLIAQQPTTDWRDEMWTTGFVLYVNTLVYAYLRLLNHDEKAGRMLAAMRHFTIPEEKPPKHGQEGFTVRHKPYFAFWTYKIYHSERFDLLGNSLAILSGIASPTRALEIITWIENECKKMQANGDLALNLPPNFFPFIRESDPDWRPRYALYNRPGEYHNGGIWPYVCSFYVAALVAAGKYRLAVEKLLALTDLIAHAREQEVDYGFNEWHKSQDGRPMGQDWQTWSAALYIYAAKCVEARVTPFFQGILRKHDNTGI